MKKRLILTLFLSFVVNPVVIYMAVKYIPTFWAHSQSARVSIATTSSKPIPIPTNTVSTTATPNIKNAGSNTCDNLLVLVDKTHSLPQDYAPADRVHLTDYSIPVAETATSARLILINDLQKLFADSVSAGVDLKVVSAYRSYDLQASLYASYVQQGGVDQANTLSAQPGHSQHQLGTAIDFSTRDLNYTLDQSFLNTKAGQWLLANAYKYGFFISYPEGQDTVTGYAFEPWHFRYIGVQNALKLMQSSMDMQTYLQEYGVLPNCAW